MALSETPVSLFHYPRRALRAAVFLILVQCALLAYPSDSWGIPGLLGLVAISRIWTIRTGWCLSLPKLWNGLFLAMVFALKFTIAPANYSTDAPFINTELAHEVGCWLVAVQILILHETDSLRRIPATVGALGCMAVLCGGDLRLHSISRDAILLMMVLFVGGLAWFAHAGRHCVQVDQKRRLRRAILLGTLLFAAVPAVWTSGFWHQHERDLEEFLVEMMRVLDGEEIDSRMILRSPMTIVSTGRIYDPEVPVMKVYQESPDPSYLRGWSYDEYNASSWSLSRSRQQPELLESRIPQEAGPWPDETPLFPLHRAASNQWSTIRIEYFPECEPNPFIPWDTAELQLAVPELNIDHRQNLSLVEDNMPTHLAAYIPSVTEDEPEPSPNSAVWRLPEKLDPRIRELAEEVFRGTQTDAERIRAVEQFFRKNFQYQIGLEPPQNQDPITHFLIDRPPAHCEYFATGAAILLRLGGVATRYVTGFVPSEYHSGGFWMARRKDGHAWVEAYDSAAKHWVTVEATPSDGLPDRRVADWSTAWAERWRVWLAEFKRRVSVNGFFFTLGQFLQATSVRVILSLAFVAIWIVIARKYRRSPTVTRIAEASNSSQQLSELERILSRHGLERKSSETLLQFRDRIVTTSNSPTLQPIAQWYGKYGLIRYDEIRSEEQLQELDAVWKQMAPEARKAQGSGADHS